MFDEQQQNGAHSLPFHYEHAWGPIFDVSQCDPATGLMIDITAPEA